MNIIINNKIILDPIINIIKQIKIESNNKYFSQIQDKGDYLRVTCPYHKDGQESHPSCSIYTRVDNNDICAGTLHCFTCGERKQLYQVVSHCLNLNDDDLGKEWLEQRFGQVLSQKTLELPELTLQTEQMNYLNSSILDTYEYDNPEALNYLINQRHLDINILHQFSIGYNAQTKSVTFPTWNSSGNLVGIFERNITKKLFTIPTKINKPIYLLNYVISHNITNVYVVESQINALTLWGWNKPAIALFGTGTDYQYNELKKSGIRHFILCFDGDNAGIKGRDRFIQAMPSSILIDYINIPSGKDVNDLTFEEFKKLEELLNEL